MYDILKEFKNYIKANSKSIDNFVFCLHYRVTFIFLLACTTIITGKQFFGDVIDCVAEVVDKKTINSFCWMQTTYTVMGKLTGVEGVDFAHPGVASRGIEDKEEIRKHTYYQWVSFVLGIQALFFYFPRYLWKNWESKRVASLSENLEKPILKDKDRNWQKSQAVIYLAENLRQHTFYAIRFFICEVLNFMNVVTQIFLLDRFLGYEFSTYGPEVFSFWDDPQVDRPDPMAKVFPKVTKCDFWKFGKTAAVEKIDALCVLPLNIINEKIFVILWFWFVALAFISGFQLIYRFFVIYSSNFRFHLLRLKCREIDLDHLNFIYRRCDIGDWLLLRLLSKNMERKNFNSIIRDLKNKIENREHADEVVKLSKSEFDYDRRSGKIDYIYNVANYFLE